MDFPFFNNLSEIQGADFSYLLIVKTNEKIQKKVDVDAFTYLTKGFSTTLSFLVEESELLNKNPSNFEDFKNGVEYIHHKKLNPVKIRGKTETKITVFATLTNPSNGITVDKILMVDNGCNINFFLSGKTANELGLRKKEDAKVINLAAGQIHAFPSKDLVNVKITIPNEKENEFITRDEDFAVLINPTNEAEDLLGLLAMEQLNMETKAQQKRAYFFNFQ